MSLPALVEPGPELTPEQVTRYARHLLLPTVGREGQRRLLGARVAVVGAGGLGSPALMYLAAAGVGRLTIIDDDAVDATNLQRQVIHDAMSVGLSKVESAVDRVGGLNADCDVRGREVHLDPDNAVDVLRDHDIVLDGSDNFETRYAVDAACHELGVPLVWAAVYRTAAHLTTFWTAAPGGQGVGLRDLFPRPPAPGSVPACGDSGVMGALVGQVGSMMAGEAIKLITGAGCPLLGRVLYIDSLTTTQREIPLAASDRYLGAQPPASADLPTCATVSADQLAADLQGGSPPFVLDVREAAERDFGVIPGSVHLPLAVLTDGDPDELRIPRDRPTVLVCKTGPRAYLAAGALQAQGYQRLSVLDGGMTAWAEQIDPSLPRY
ncbi:adenylyltransferase/sulfurtransferase MoeZ [Marihabitans asiaticum]|uniref:Adenylyltransferase/sulfurtransferase n=1 Tax=Marihabitans asiaticum TaxID=415218 RepID=A0A560W7Z6_9MICO|nr:ThiF family adenylyltransferase [Marihabitans asiaticum]TWD13757.1 adenylyltransferase/sulfurtransferase [Marihabitans asiaticum]